MDVSILQDILIILGFSVVIVFVLQRLKLPSILGFIITGIVIGPYALGLIASDDQIETLSEIGIILLLFVIGMELSLKQLASIKKTVFIGGGMQVGLTVLAAGAVYFFLGNGWSESTFIGFLFSLSSTAIVLSIFQERNQLNTPQGKNVLAILIFQDIIVVPMMLFTPIIAGEGGDVTHSILMLVLKSAIVVVVTIVSARYLVPKLMYAVAKTRSKDLFLLTTFAICFAVAFLTSMAGLSLALGAFLAGLIISESEYSHQATSIILPFRELFTSFFFISIGMLLDVHFFINHILIVVLIVMGLLVVKAGVIGMAIRVLKYSPKTALITGLSLFQVGEFSFVLSKIGIDYNLLGEKTYQYFLAISILSMLITPFIIMFADTITERFLQSKVMQRVSRNETYEVEDSHIDEKTLENHLIIVGFGVNGSNLARAAHYSNIPYVVIELNAETVLREKEKGIPIIFGDATKEHILSAVHLRKARAVVVGVSDDKATKTIVSNIRLFAKSVFLLVRTRYVKDITELIALGANEVIPEEFETSVEIFSRILHNFLIPEDEIEHFIDVIRADDYELFKNKKLLPKTFKPNTAYPDFNITCLKINKDSGKFIGKKLKDIDVRGQFGINILAIKRKDEMLDHIEPTEKLLYKDLIFINGKPENIEAFNKIIQ